jgi:hypothetical protein
VPLEDDEVPLLDDVEPELDPELLDPLLEPEELLEVDPDEDPLLLLEPEDAPLDEPEVDPLDELLEEPDELPLPEELVELPLEDPDDVDPDEDPLLEEPASPASRKQVQTGPLSPAASAALLLSIGNSTSCEPADPHAMTKTAANTDPGLIRESFILHRLVW